MFILQTFNDIQNLLSKTNGKVVGEVMTPAPLVIQETTNLEDAARFYTLQWHCAIYLYLSVWTEFKLSSLHNCRLLLETKYRRLPVVDSAAKLVCRLNFISCLSSYILFPLSSGGLSSLKVGIITRGNVVRAALEIKRAIEKSSQA